MTAQPVNLYPAFSTVLAQGGVSQRVFFGPLAFGGIITNPIQPQDQNLTTVEVLYVSLDGPATLTDVGTTAVIQPGATFLVPPTTQDVWINAASTGHRFSAVGGQQPPGYVAPSGNFPPAGPTTLQNIIASYLYVQYNDDDNLQALFATYNALGQVSYLDWFNDTPLSVYTNPNISGALLDWVGEGFYGMSRPALPYGTSQDIGTYNTFLLNEIAINDGEILGNQNYYYTNDDIFKRVLTWHTYKGDGKYFTIRWLKRRVMRFLYGVNGTDPPVDVTYPISVSIVGSQVNITISAGMRTVTGGALYDLFAFNEEVFNDIETAFAPSPSIPAAVIFKAAVASGVLELPFQYTYVVTVF